MTSGEQLGQRRVFPDTGVLLAMLIFPQDRTGQPTLASEVMALQQEGAFTLVLSQAVIDELDEVIARDFPTLRPQVVRLLVPLTGHLTRWPMPQEVAAVMPYTTDPADAPIFAAAVVAQPDIVLSNDFRAFHTDQAKRFWAEHGIRVVSLYGRRPPAEQPEGAR